MLSFVHAIGLCAYSSLRASKALAQDIVTRESFRLLKSCDVSFLVPLFWFRVSLEILESGIQGEVPL